MKRNTASDTVEFSLGPHAARAGWEVARITYDASNPKHLAQIEAAITAMVSARGEHVRHLPRRRPAVPAGSVGAGR
jgi:hypothetical protein